MTKVLLDTDILSEILKGKSAVVTARAGKYLAQQGCFTTSAITVAEVVYGFRRVGREDRVTQFEASLEVAEVLALDDAAARLAGRINADLERVGRVNVLIAAIALRNGLPIVTGNVVHFEQVRLVGYDLYIDNWRKT